MIVYFNIYIYIYIANLSLLMNNEKFDFPKEEF